MTSTEMDNRAQMKGLMAGVVLTLADASGPRDSYTTDGVSEPHCFTDLPLGTYQLTIKPPANYGSTTPGAMTISLSAGVKPNVMYGARRSGQAPAPTYFRPCHLSRRDNAMVAL